LRLRAVTLALKKIDRRYSTLAISTPKHRTLGKNKHTGAPIPASGPASGPKRQIFDTVREIGDVELTYGSLAIV